MEALRRTCARFRRDFSPVPWRGGGLQGMHEFGTRLRNSLDCLIESGLVRQRGLIEATDLADELQGCCTDLAVCNGRRKIEQQFDVATHTSPVYFAEVGAELYDDRVASGPSGATYGLLLRAEERAQVVRKTDVAANILFAHQEVRVIC